MNFFDPNAHSTQLFAMGSQGHLALVLLLFGLVAALLLARRSLQPLRESRAFMAGGAAFILSLELISDALKFIYPCEPAFERIPLHLCATLKVAVAVMILIKREDLVKYVSIASIGCGFISFVNLNLAGESFGNFEFWHYVFGHLYLVLAPTFLFLTGEVRYGSKHHFRSMFGLFVWSVIIFFVNWAFDTNYMYTGPHNETAVPFIPARLMEWPLNYTSYVAVGFVLLNSVYAMVKFGQRRAARKSGAASLSDAALAR